MRSRQPFILGFFLVANLFVPCVRAQSDPGGEPILRNAREVLARIGSRAQRLGTSAGPDPDTVYIGKSFTNHTAPDNYWNIHTGTYRPGTNDPNNALWDWDNTVGIQAADSLQGWWPLHRQYNSTGGLTLTDDNRPWWALDHGNIGNYVISQQAAAKRTFGVVGYWHADPGNPGAAPNTGILWSPLSGAKSAWCGLREHGDNTVKDAVTGQNFNQDVVQFLHDATAAGGGSPNRFPGYVDQMDQMLYRDIAMTSGQSLTLSFKYRTRMSTSIGTVTSTRTGWFHGDPLAVAPGNFISSSNAVPSTSAPQDSFMVYVGAPVDDAACVYSDGVTRPVYDRQRRWFSEVLKVFGAGANYFEIFQRAGNNPTDTTDATPTAGPIVVPAATISTILGAPAGNVRLVFRVKTNRGFADSDSRNSGYNSASRGAVLLDDVTIDTGAGPVVIGDFETPEQGGVNAIDNRFPLPPALQATDVWRSTGKPPAEYFHLEALSGLTYNDLCGPPSSPARKCNMGGLVLTCGNHDDGERAGDDRFTAFREISQFAVSPTINLRETSPGVPNSQGITATIANASNDYLLRFDIYTGMFNLSFTGESWVFGSQSYPAMQANGARCWAQPAFPGFLVMNPEPQCMMDLEGFFNNGTPFLTSNPNGIPDSLRLFLAHQQQCFRFGVSLGCNSNEGGYFDNVTLAFNDLPGVPGQASATSSVSLGTIHGDIWQWTNDAFPVNETVGLPGTAAFDTTTALIKTGLNIAQSTGNELRFDIPGDTTSVLAANARVTTPDDPALSTVRVDLVFRILPGPGNYQIAAGRFKTPEGVPGPSNKLLQVPTSQAGLVTPGDASFWGQYIADPGAVSAGTHNGHTFWDPLTWNSARCDTAEQNLFPGPPFASILDGSTATRGWMSAYHEADPKFAALGIDKFRCFVIDTTKAASSSPSLDNMSCNGVLPAWITTVPRSRTGWDGSATTKEMTKIIPDGLLTPGSHVQYFYRKSHSIDPLLEYAMTPDTNFITPQPNEGPSTDQHRWQQFSVLPDRWKNLAFGGQGMACMLYVDLDDRRGNEGRFVSMLDSIGATRAAKRGAHNGWTAPGTVNIDGIDVRTNMSVAVSNQNAQPGSVWDMYGVKGSESFTANAGGLGSRLANRTNMGFAAGKYSAAGPTSEMLRTYYRMIALLSGDVDGGVLGPFANHSQNDIALLSDFLTTAPGSAQPSALLIQGDGFGRSEQATSAVDPSHTQFLNDKLGVVFRNTSYVSLSGNTNACADLPTVGGIAPAGMTARNDIYGVTNACSISNDVYTRNPALAEAFEGAFYENVGTAGPYVSAVVKPATPERNWIAVTSGYDIENLFSRYCDSEGGRLAYYLYMLTHVFTGACFSFGGGATLETPQSNRPFVNFMKIGNSVMRQGGSLVRLGVAQTGRVQVSIYDVAGRKVRTLADRIFPPGEHTLHWDGTDDQARKLPRGVYFVRTTLQPAPARVIVLNP
ncbi:MAG TPA: FlgD immunoglobulin-like domain containing protein [Candidatus Eisenbacteria bacterium]|jgi:hypothetical protein